MAIVEDQISFARVEDGEDGRGIKGTPVSTYAQSTSGTTPPTTWSDTRPNVPAGQYLWTRVVTTYTDDTTSETQTPTLMGKEGTPGLGIKSKSISYAIGTSGNTPPSSGWQVTIPIVSANQYLWTRTTIVYTDDSKTDAYSVGKMGADGVNAKLLYLTASAENMAFNADDTPKTTQTINISAKLQNVTGTATFTAIPYIGNTAQTAITLGGTGNTRTLTSSQWTNKDWTLIAITATLDNLSDTLSIVKVKDGKEGETYYPHRGYLMADGTFTKVYPEENTYTANTVFQSLSGGVLPVREEETAPRGFRFTGVSGGSGSFRIRDVIKGNGIWTVKFKARQSQSYSSAGFSLDICDSPSPAKRFTLNQDNSWTEISLTVEVKNWSSTMNFVDFSGIDWLYFFVSDFKVSRGDGGLYTPAPSDDYENAYPKYEGFYSDTNVEGSDNPDDYKPWTPFMGPQGGQGPKGDSAPLISLSGATQAITVDKDGKITPASSFAVTGTAVNTAISNWTYSLNGGNFGSAVPTGVTRSGNIVTIDPTKAVFDTLTIKAADATVSDVFTISRIKDGGEGPSGSDAYTVFLTNESYTFAGSTTAALAGSTTTEVIVYKGINKITPTSITVGTKPTGLSSSVSGSIITLTATTALVSKSGTVPITITADGKTFTKQFSYALSLQGATGSTGKGVAAEEISYSISQDGITPPTSGWSGTRPTPKAGWYMWTRTRFKYTDNTYSAYFYLVAQQGKDAIVISDTAPANPSIGTLWQKPSDPNVQKWNGTKWENWGIAPENIVADNLVVKDGRFEKLVGAELESGTITNSFDFWDGSLVPNTSAQMWRRGKTTIKNAEVTTLWEDYNKSTGAKVKEGGVIHDSDGTSVYINDPSNFNQTASYRSSGILLRDSRVPSNVSGSFLSYNDLLIYPATPIPAASGWSAYATSGANQPMAVRYGRSVRLTGAFKNNTTLPNTNETYKIGTLPVGLRPSTQEKWLAKGAGTTIFQITVDTNGDIFVNYRLGWTGSTFGYLTNNSGDIFNIAGGFAAADI